MDEFLEDHIKRPRVSTYLSENDTYGKHLESNPHSATLNRRLYLGQIEESQILFIPSRVNRSTSQTLLDLFPSIFSLWVVGLSVLYTYPRSIRFFRLLFPNTKSFILTHLGIAPMMMFFNLNLLGICKGLTFIYFDRFLNNSRENSYS